MFLFFKKIILKFVAPFVWGVLVEEWEKKGDEDGLSRDQRKKELEKVFFKKEDISSSDEVKRPKVGMGIIILDTSDNSPDFVRIIMGKRINKNGHGDGEWSLPGGHLEWRETLQDCARREAFEETGLVIGKIKKFDYTNDIWEDKHYATLFVTAEIVGGVLKNKEPEKCEGWQWFDIYLNQNDFVLPKPLFLPLSDFFEDFNCRKMLINEKIRLCQHKILDK